MMYDIKKSVVDEIKTKYAAECAEVAAIFSHDDDDNFFVTVGLKHAELQAKYGETTARLIMFVGNME